MRKQPSPLDIPADTGSNRRMSLSRPCFRLHALLAALLPLCLTVSGCGSHSSVTTSTTSTTPTPTPTASCTVPSVTLTHSSTVNSHAAQLVFLDPSTYPQAVCNDGSPAAYVLRPGSGTAATRWVISLQGGDYCYDAASCATRAYSSPSEVSTTPYRNGSVSMPGLSGLQSANPSTNPDFYDASQVEALYCSSDYWSGSKNGSGTYSLIDDASWSFQGRAILNAVFADLAKNHGFAGASEVLFTGESAGGVGVYVNVNDIAKEVPATARFVAASDAGFGSPALDFSATGTPPTYTSSATPFEQSTGLQGIALWGGQGDQACAKASSTTNAFSCYEASTLLAPGGTVTLPMLVLQAQKDSVQLGYAGVSQSDIDDGSFTTQESAYVSYFATQMRSALNATNSGVSLFSPDALFHTSDDTDSLFTAASTFPSGAYSPQQVVHSWYQNPCSPQRDVAN